LILIILGAKPFLDGLWYMKTAEAIWNNNFLYPNSELRDAPLTPYFFALFYPLKLIFGINGYAIGSIFCFSGLIIVVYKIAFEVFERIEIANIAAIITTLYPFFNFYAITILTEPIYILLLYISLYFAIRFIKTKKIKFALFFSIFFALDSLVRFANLSMFVFFIILFLFFTKEKLKTTFFMIISFCLIMSFWWIRNYFVFNEFVATAVGESGKIFYAGNNPSNKSGGGTKDEVDFSKFNHIKDIKLKDEAMKKAALNWIKQNPLQWIKLEFIKLKRFFSPFFFAKSLINGIIILYLY